MLNVSLVLVQRFGTQQVDTLLLYTHFNNDDVEGHWKVKQFETKLCDAKEGAELRATYEHVLILFKNKPHRQFTFPDPVKIERELAQNELWKAEQALLTYEGQLKTLRAPQLAQIALEEKREKAVTAVREAKARVDEVMALPSGINTGAAPESLAAASPAATPSADPATPEPPMVDADASAGSDGITLGLHARPTTSTASADAAAPARNARLDTDTPASDPAAPAANGPNKVIHLGGTVRQNENEQREQQRPGHRS